MPLRTVLRHKFDDCVGCKEMDDALIKLKTKIENSYKKSETEVENFRKVIAEMQESVKTMVSSDELQTTWADIASKQVNNSLTVAAEEIKDIGKAIQEVKVARLEEEDKEARRNNIIFYRVPES